MVKSGQYSTLQGQSTKDKLSKHIAGQYMVKSGQYFSLQGQSTKDKLSKLIQGNTW